MVAFLWETFLLGLTSLRLHKLRSLLTALGIIVGVVAVIVMVAIGQGAKKAALEQIDQLGARNILIRSIRPPQSSDASSRSQRVLDYGIKRVDLERLRMLQGVRVMVPLRDTEQKVIRREIRAFANAIGTTADIFPVINLRTARGQCFTEEQYEEANSVCVIGAKVAQQLFPFEDPLGETVQVGTSDTGAVVLTVIGVLEPTGLRAGSDGGGILTRDLDQDIYFPLTLARQAFGTAIVHRQPGSVERKQIELTEIWLEAERIEDVERIAGTAEHLLRVGHPGAGDVEVKAPIQILRNAEHTNRIFNFIMVGIASFSLVVGGIGIMNIMLATVTERTREIGIRRALGAKRGHITLQFLLETTVISLAGGVIGIGVGVGMANLLPVFVEAMGWGNYPTQISPLSVVVSFVVSGVIGIGFGLYPAMIAARMNPIEALRHQ